MLVLDTGRRREVAHLAFSPDSRWLAAVGDCLAVFDVATAAVIAFWDTWVGGAAGGWVGDDGTTLVMPAGASGLRLFDIPNQSMTSRKWESRGYVTCGFAPDGRHFVGFDYGTRTLSGWRFTGPTAITRVWERSDVLDGAAPPWRFSGLVHFPAGDRFASFLTGGPSRTPNRVMVRSAATGEMLSDTPGPDHNLCDLRVSADGTRFAARQGMGPTAFLWPADGAGPPIKFRRPSGKHFTGLAFHPAGRLLAAASNDNTVTLIDAAVGAVAETFDWNIGRLRSVAFSPDGCLAAAGSDKGRVVVWDVDG